DKDWRSNSCAAWCAMPSAMVTSVQSARCGPCGSVLPTGHNAMGEVANTRCASSNVSCARCAATARPACHDDDGAVHAVQMLAAPQLLRYSLDSDERRR